ncbi:MAG: hypothetical protein AB7L91_10225 [Dehalococcoidia bacterium]
MAEIRPLWLASLVLVAVLLPGVTSAWASSAVEPAIPLEEASLQAAGPGGALLDGPLVPSALVAVPAGSDFDAAVVDAAPGPLLERSQVVTLYGYPGVPAMGDLGGYTPDEAAAEVRRLAWVYDALNGERGAAGALHVVVSVAHPAPLADGSYLSHLDPAVIAEYVEAARRNGVLLVLDTQLGMVDPVEEARRLEPFLAEPFVHLALDPEFAMRAKGGVPGAVIGSVDAAEVNAVQAYLAGVVRAHGLPSKLLVVHQFRADMLTHSVAWEDAPEVQRVINVDGWGDLETKLETYEAFALAPYAQHAGVKLFEGWDEPMLTPSEVLSLARQPDFVVYQ